MFIYRCFFCGVECRAISSGDIHSWNPNVGDFYNVDFSCCGNCLDTASEYNGNLTRICKEVRTLAKDKVENLIDTIAEKCQTRRIKKENLCQESDSSTPTS